MVTNTLLSNGEVGAAPNGASSSAALVREYLPDIAKIVFFLALVFGTAELFWGNSYLGLIDLAPACWLLKSPACVPLYWTASATPSPCQT